MAIRRLGYTGTPNQLLTVGATCYRITALASGTLVAAASVSATKMFVYKYSADVAAIGIVGLYDASLNLLVSQSFNLSGAAGWREVAISSVSLTNGATYYPAMEVNANCLMYSDTSGNGCSRITGASLPNPWTEIQNRTYAPAVYLEYDDGSSSSSIVPILAHHLVEQGAL